MKFNLTESIDIYLKNDKYVSNNNKKQVKDMKTINNYILMLCLVAGSAISYEASAETYKMLFEKSVAPFYVPTYDANGFDENALHRDTRTAYNSQGYDINGYNAQGYDINGYNAQGYDINGYDVNGLDINGVPLVECLYTGNAATGGAWNGHFVYKSYNNYYFYYWNSSQLAAQEGLVSYDYNGYRYTPGDFVGAYSGNFHKICRQRL